MRMAKDTQAPGPCASCGHDPACGFSSVIEDDVQSWYCHADDHSCYAPSDLVILDSWEVIPARRYEGEVEVM